MGGAPRQHPVLPADRRQPPAGHWFLLLWCSTTVGPAPKGLPTRKCPAHPTPSGCQDSLLCVHVPVPGEDGRKPPEAPAPLHGAWESWVRALPPSTWDVLAIPVPPPAGLSAHISAPQQPCVLPALHHQTSLCCAVLQPPCPGLSKPMTQPPQPEGQGSQLLRDLSCGGCSDASSCAGPVLLDLCAQCSAPPKVQSLLGTSWREGTCCFGEGDGTRPGNAHLHLPRAMTAQSEALQTFQLVFWSLPWKEG